MTDCNSIDLQFHPLGGRQVVAGFDGGTISSDAGAVLLRVETDVDSAVRAVEEFVEFGDIPDVAGWHECEIVPSGSTGGSLAI